MLLLLSQIVVVVVDDNDDDYCYCYSIVCLGHSFADEHCYRYNLHMDGSGLQLDCVDVIETGVGGGCVVAVGAVAAEQAELFCLDYLGMLFVLSAVDGDC